MCTPTTHSAFCETRNQVIGNTAWHRAACLPSTMPFILHWVNHPTITPWGLLQQPFIGIPGPHPPDYVPVAAIIYEYSQLGWVAGMEG